MSFAAAMLPNSHAPELPNKRSVDAQTKAAFYSSTYVTTNLSFPPCDKGPEFLINCRIHAGLLIIREKITSIFERPLGRAFCAFRLPLLDRRVVEQLRHEERTLEVLLRMRMAEVMSARSDIPHRRNRFV